MLRCITVLVLLAGLAQARLLTTPFEALHAIYGDDAAIEKKNVLLTIDKAKQVYRSAGVKEGKKIFRTFKVKKGAKTVAYAILVSRVVRSKNAAVLYIFTPQGAIDGIEVVAFNEPPEFTPPKAYLDQFKGKRSSDTLRVGKDIPTITGATMSARNVTDGARLASRIFDLLFKGNR